jgi:hypothetical protein
VTNINNVAAEKPAWKIYASTAGLEIVTSEYLSLKVFDLAGRLLYKNNINHQTQIPFNRGTYIVNVNENQNNSSKKIIIL